MSRIDERFVQGESIQAEKPLYFLQENRRLVTPKLEGMTTGAPSLYKRPEQGPRDESGTQNQPHLQQAPKPSQFKSPLHVFIHVAQEFRKPCRPLERRIVADEKFRHSPQGRSPHLLTNVSDRAPHIFTKGGQAQGIGV